MKAAVLLTAALLVLGLSADGALINLRLMHYNDNHARFEAQDSSFNTCSNATQCFGGFAKQQAALQFQRVVAPLNNRDFLALHAGDQFTGTVWDYVYTSQNKQIAHLFLNQQGLDGFTLGNHEFDFGPATLASFLGNLTVPVTSCNVDVSKVPALAGKLQRFIMTNLTLSKTKVAIIGFTTLETPVTSSPGPLISFLDPATVVASCVADAKAAGANLVIALSHLGYAADKALAALPAAKDLDLIVGGHSHSLLYTGGVPNLLTSPVAAETTPVDGAYPTFIANSGSSIPIVQALWGSRYMGVLDGVFNTNTSTWTSLAGNPVLLGDTASTNNAPSNPPVAAQIAALKGPIDALAASPAGVTAVDLNGERAAVRNNETNLGNLVVDAMPWYIRNKTTLLTPYPNLPVVSHWNGGGIRASIPKGPVTRGQVVTVLPFGNRLIAKKVTAAALRAALNNGVSQWTGDANAPGRFPQVGGLRFAFNSNASAAARVGRIVLKNGPSEVDLDKYGGDVLVLMNDFVGGGGDGYTSFQPFSILLDTSTSADQIVADYMTATSPVSPVAENRIENCAVTPAADLCAAAAPAPAPVPTGPSPPPPIPPLISPPRGNPSPSPAVGPASASCATARRGYSVSRKFNVGEATRTTDWKACCASCAATAGCKAWVFSPAKHCQLKSTAAFVSSAQYKRWYSGSP